MLPRVRGQRSPSNGPISNRPARASAERNSRKANGLACARPNLETIAPLLHSKTNRLVVAAEATEILEKTDM
ncbi:hypothetical protein D3C80_1368280 [compost metagenome]